MSDAVWYFAFGSNLKRERLRERIGEWAQERKATLRGYELMFAKGYEKHDSGKANIKPKPNSEVKGAIYLITEEQLRMLDCWEGVHKRVYKRMPVNVESQGEMIPAITYVMCKEVCPLKPSEKYLKLIVEGLAEHGYEQGTIQEVIDKANI